MPPGRNREPNIASLARVEDVAYVGLGLVLAVSLLILMTVSPAPDAIMGETR